MPVHFWQFIWEISLNFRYPADPGASYLGGRERAKVTPLSIQSSRSSSERAPSGPPCAGHPLAGHLPPLAELRVGCIHESPHPPDKAPGWPVGYSLEGKAMV